jgi:hypothetical protein
MCSTFHHPHHKTKGAGHIDFRLSLSSVVNGNIRNIRSTAGFAGHRVSLFLVCVELPIGKQGRVLRYSKGTICVNPGCARQGILCQNWTPKLTEWCKNTHLKSCYHLLAMDRYYYHDLFHNLTIMIFIDLCPCHQLCTQANTVI